MNFELNKKNIILLIIFALVALGVIIVNNNYNKKPKKILEEKITLVEDYSRFFTISNAGSKYINYLKDKDKDSIIKLLNSDYINLNNINKHNLEEKLQFLDTSEYAFEARKMFQEKLNENIMRYYVYGYLKKVIMDEDLKPDDYYLIIDLDIKNNRFEVMPYDGQIFLES
ncbi:MAG: hypothetical protein PHF21_03885 [Bacilli bacterium]|nr:hypothetical protein [Bacilli bacterium]